MKPRTVFYGFLVILVLSSNTSKAQVKISSLLQDSERSLNPSDPKLFMLEFWATWCGPCLTVSDYLKVIQRQFSEDLYILSLSKESSERIEKFLKKHPTTIASAVDYDGHTFLKYHVTDLPYAVLLNADAEVVWSGNPANLSPEVLQSFIKKNSKTLKPNRFINLVPYDMEDSSVEELGGDFELTLYQTDETTGMAIYRDPKFMIIQGRLKLILSYLLKISPTQLQLPSIADKGYQLKLYYNKNHKSIFENLITQLDMKVLVTEKEMEVYELYFLNDDQFWNSSQLEWGVDSPQFLVDDFQFSADNSTVADFLYKLSELKSTALVYDPNVLDNTTPYDWQIHYHYFDLMSEDLKNNFGITIKKSSALRPFYILE